MLNNNLNESINIDGKDYVIAGPYSGGIVLVRFAENSSTREALCKLACEDNGFSPKILSQNFPIGSILCYGREASIILHDNEQGASKMFGLYNMRNLKFVPHENISFESLMKNGSPFTDYNRNALFSLCDDPEHFPMFFAENGLPTTDEGKLMYFDLANRVINMKASNTIDFVYETLHSGTPRTSNEEAKDNVFKHLHDNLDADAIHATFSQKDK